MTAIRLRPATAADSEFCFRLHRAAMRDYVEAIWGWDEDTQRSFHQSAFDPPKTSIVTVNSHDAGVWIVERRPAEIYLARIEIHPDYQNRGIGGQLIEGLLRESQNEGKPVMLDVLNVNQRALALYKRLGFQEVSRHGPENRKIQMRSPPKSTTDE